MDSHKYITLAMHKPTVEVNSFIEYLEFVLRKNNLTNLDDIFETSDLTTGRLFYDKPDKPKDSENNEEVIGNTAFTEFFTDEHYAAILNILRETNGVDIPTIEKLNNLAIQILNPVFQSNEWKAFAGLIKTETIKKIAGAFLYALTLAANKKQSYQLNLEIIKLNNELKDLPEKTKKQKKLAIEHQIDELTTSLKLLQKKLEYVTQITNHLFLPANEILMSRNKRLEANEKPILAKEFDPNILLSSYDQQLNAKQIKKPLKDDERFLFTQKWLEKNIAKFQIDLGLLTDNILKNRNVEGIQLLPSILNDYIIRYCLPAERDSKSTQLFKRNIRESIQKFLPSFKEKICDALLQFATDQEKNKFAEYKFFLPDDPIQRYKELPIYSLSSELISQIDKIEATIAAGNMQTDILKHRSEPHPSIAPHVNKKENKLSMNTRLFSGRDHRKSPPISSTSLKNPNEHELDSTKQILTSESEDILLQSERSKSKPLKNELLVENVKKSKKPEPEKKRSTPIIKK